MKDEKDKKKKIDKVKTDEISKHKNEAIGSKVPKRQKFEK